MAGLLKTIELPLLIGYQHSTDRTPEQPVKIFWRKREIKWESMYVRDNNRKKVEKRVITFFYLFKA